MGYNYKDRYYDNLGNDIEYRFPGNVRFLTASRLSGGSNTRQSPATSTSSNMGNTPVHNVLDGGNHYRIGLQFVSGEGSDVQVLSGFVGTNKYTTKAKFIGNVYSTGSRFGSYAPNLYFKDLTFCGGSLVVNVGQNNTKFRFLNCIIENNPVLSGSLHTADAINCIFKTNVTFIKASSRISFLNAITQGTFASLSAYEGCDIIITQSVLNSYYSNYISFDKCRFKFLGDAEYTALNGSTPEELRNDFIARCDADGLTYNRITEYDFENIPLGRWLFTVDNSNEAIIYKDTDIYKFESVRGFKFGFGNNRPEKITISNTVNLPNSINPNSPNSGNIEFNNGYITFPDSLDITEKNDFYVTSNIIPLNRIRKIDEIICPNNLEWKYGFLLDAEKNIDLDNPILAGENKIEPGVSYLVRSTDKNYATAIYNGTTYNTSLASPKANIIIGVDGATSFNAGQGNPVLYKIPDNRGYQSVLLRIVNRIPADIIKTGNLSANYWYLVEHDTDQSDKTGYITYNGVKYYAGSSFLVKAGVLSFAVSGNIHLRRCWNENYNPNDAQDKAFWLNEQKPKWINVNPDDLYCLMKSNNENELEMQADGNGVYITSGHPDFYNMVLGAGGIAVPKYPIKGAYIQLRIPVSTLNIM